MVPKFKNRYNISFRYICREAGDATEETVTDWVAKLLSIIDRHEPKDGASDYETGFFFHVLPSKTLWKRQKLWWW
jgi:hypothetical protein